MENSNSVISLTGFAAKPCVTAQQKQGLALNNLYSFGSSCAGMAALANQAINEGELTIDTAQHLANISEKLQRESSMLAQLLSELFIDGASHEADRG